MTGRWVVCIKNDNRTEEALLDFISENDLRVENVSYNHRRSETIRLVLINDADRLALTLKIPILWMNEAVWYAS